MNKTILKVGKKYRITTPDANNIEMYLISKEICCCDICNRGRTDDGTDGTVNSGYCFSDSLTVEKQSEYLQIGKSCRSKCSFELIKE